MEKHIALQEKYYLWWEIFAFFFLFWICQINNIKHWLLQGKKVVNSCFSHVYIQLWLQCSWSYFTIPYHLYQRTAFKSQVLTGLMKLALGKLSSGKTYCSVNLQSLLSFSILIILILALSVRGSIYLIYQKSKVFFCGKGKPISNNIHIIN